jgi:hypothetical protein
VESLAAKDFRNPEREHCAECENLVPTWYVINSLQIWILSN